MEEKKTLLGRLESIVLINFLTLITDKKENISRTFERIVPFGFTGLIRAYLHCFA